MDENLKGALSTIKNFILAAILFACAFILYKNAVFSGNWPLGLVSMGPLLLGAIIIAFPIARWASWPVGKFFYDGEEFDRPQPMFSVPEGKRKNGHYQEAFDGFQKIAGEYPQELKSYVEMIDIAIVDMKNKKLADSVFHQGIATLDNKEDCDTLVKMYKAISSRLDINLHAAHHPFELKKQDRELSEPDYYR